MKLTIHYEARFFARHPFLLSDAHDSGDEDPRAWDEHVPVGGFVASYDVYLHSNAVEGYVP